MLIDFINLTLPAIDEEIRRAVSKPLFKSYSGLEEIISYHLGWENRDAQGKKIRPVMVLLSAAAVGADWKCALPSAAAVELFHNFSLIHDDIEDGSHIRRGQETVWKKWGAPLAINAGDAVFALAFDALARLEESVNPQAALRSMQLLAETSLMLTCGQHLDITQERERIIGMDNYWSMIAGKTAALLTACIRLGAIAGQAMPEQEHHLGEFGRYLGLAFQVWDDWLGIWGNATELGKSTESDLVTGKKTLPIVYALEKRGEFYRRWMQKPITPEDVAEVSAILVEAGAQAFTEHQAKQLTGHALESLHAAGIANTYVEGLEELALSLLQRSK